MANRQYTVPQSSTPGSGGGGGSPTGAAGGDLGSTYPNPTVVSVAHVTTGVLPVANGGTGTVVIGETPSGTINGSNVTFTLAHTPANAALSLYLNGARLSGGGVDYTLATATITFVVAPKTGNILLADYRY